MSQYVIVQDNRVVATGLRANGEYEVHYPDGIPSDWISAGDDVANGWSYDGSAFSEPTVSIETLRIERDKLLSSSDFTQLPDVLSSTDRATWATYRQELRDLPSGYTAVANPVYPTRP